mmetsp:Transcript_3061/g.9348  ORF Transcript_3061/g.9348 Transcript_3061/m.9348 type:complete len:217 (-) Transcript_3061:13-663(-)
MAPKWLFAAACLFAAVSAVRVPRYDASGRQMQPNTQESGPSVLSPAVKWQKFINDYKEEVVGVQFEAKHASRSGKSYTAPQPWAAFAGLRVQSRDARFRAATLVSPDLYVFRGMQFLKPTEEGSWTRTCSADHAIVGVAHSDYDTEISDRTFTFICGLYENVEFDACRWTEFKPWKASKLYVGCGADEAITGFASAQDGVSTDRQWRAKCCSLTVV